MSYSYFFPLHTFITSSPETDALFKTEGFLKNHLSLLIAQGKQVQFNWGAIGIPAVEHFALKFFACLYKLQVFFNTLEEQLTYPSNIVDELDLRWKVCICFWLP